MAIEPGQDPAGQEPKPFTGRIDPRTIVTPPPPPPPPAPGAAYAYPPAPPRHGSGILTRLITGLLGTLLLVSIMLNIYLGMYFVSTTTGPWQRVYAKGDKQHPIVILPVLGLIDEDTAVFVRGALKSMESDPPAAIVLRVDSGGGGVQPSDLIWKDLQDFKARHNVPIVASFGQLAASGGYYIAAGCDQILAEPTTITGSIGVMSMAFTLDEMLSKIGVTPEIQTASQSPEKDVANNIFRSWNERDRAVQQAVIDAMYERFLEVVTLGRGHLLDAEKLRALANGAVYMQSQAIANQLVDKGGYLEDAIAEAATLAGVPTGTQPHVTWISPSQSLGLLGMVHRGQRGAARTNASAHPPTTAAQWRTWLEELRATRYGYRMGS